MNRNSDIVFVCEHGAAKSIVAAAYFNKVASEMDLDLHAIARGTNPDHELSSQAVKGLQEDGLMPAESIPQKLTSFDIQAAQRIVTFYELPAEYQQPMSVERWDDIPPVSESYEAARDAILERIHRLVSQLKRHELKR